MKKGKGSSYSVGYGKPPKQTRFKPGQSGNPKGRPKCARGIAAEWEEEARQLVSVTENGRTLKISKQKAVIKSTFAKAIKGDAKSVQIILNNCGSFRSQGALSGDELDALDKAILEAYRNG